MTRPVAAVVALVLLLFGGVTLLKLAGGERQAADDAEIDAAARARVQRFWTSYRTATAHRVAGRPSEAVRAYEAALALDSLHEDALYYLGSVRFERGELAAAERVWLRLLAVNRLSARAHSQLGTLYSCPDREPFFRPVQAEEAFRRALAINREETGPLVRLGLLAVVRGERDAARRWLDEALRTNERSVEGHYVRGYVEWREGNVNAAVRHLDAAIAATRRPEAPEGVPGEGDTRPGAVAWRPGTRCPTLDSAMSPLGAFAGPSDGARADTLYRRWAAALP